MDAHTDENYRQDTAQNPRIESFRDECMLFRTFNRPVFVEEIEFFIESASKDDLANLRTHIARRAKSLTAHCGDGGRPRGHCDPKWLVKAKIVAWRRHVDKRSWGKIAESVGVKPTKENIRTLTRRRDRYAAMVWDALTEVLESPNPSSDRIDQVLDRRKVQLWLGRKASLPFRRVPLECKKLVQALLPLGRNASGQEFARLLHYYQKRANKTTELTVKKRL
jgi:hypothetical protein